MATLLTPVVTPIRDESCGSAAGWRPGSAPDEEDSDWRRNSAMCQVGSVGPGRSPVFASSKDTGSGAAQGNHYVWAKNRRKMQTLALRQSCRIILDQPRGTSHGPGSSSRISVQPLLHPRTGVHVYSFQREQGNALHAAGGPQRAMSELPPATLRSFCGNSKSGTMGRDLPRQRKRCLTGCLYRQPR